MLTVTATNAGDCRRALHYRLADEPPSNPIPAQVQRLEAVARYSQAAAVDALKDGEWTVHNPERNDVFSPAPGINVRFRQPYRVSHPVFTEGIPVFALISTTSQRLFQIFEDFGAMVSHPKATDRMATAFAFARQQNNPDVDLTLPQFLVLLNRSDGALELEPLFPDELETRIARLTSRLTDLAEHQQQDAVPDREFEPRSRQCQHCQWLSLCHGDRLPANQGESDAAVTADQLDQAIADYAEAAAQLEITRPFEKQRDRARAVIKSYIQENGMEPVRVASGDDRWEAKVSVTEKPALSETLARVTLSPQQLADITVTTRRETVNIRKAK